jgi:hypothetical protein
MPGSPAHEPHAHRERRERDRHEVQPERPRPDAARAALRLLARDQRRCRQGYATGWKLVVYHTGDPQSEGNGVYYKVCEADAGSASCGDTRPGRTGPSDDEVYAQVLTPTYVALSAVIDIHYDAP